MANPWSIAVTGWAVIVIGWLLVPIFSLLVNKLFAYLVFDASKELPELELVTIPALKETLGRVEEQRMVRAATDEEGSRYDLEILDKMDTRLKSALCQAEDILDLVDYHRIEKEVTGDSSNWGLQGLYDAGACIACWMGTLILGCIIHITPAPLVQFVHSMKQKLGQLFVGIISLWNSGALVPVSQVTSTVGVQRLCGCFSQIVANINSCYQSLFSWCTDRIADARYYRDWSYEQLSFNINEQKDGNVPITETIRLRKQIKSIEDILTSSKKSNQLNQKETIRLSNCTVKEGANESSSKQKEIDELYRVVTGQEVFGRDKDRADISRMLREGPDTNAASSSTNTPYSVIGIYGITGSGKTMLAQYVCDYEKGVGHFNPIMFIHVGKTFSVGHIFRDMMEQITQSRPPNDGLKSLKKTLEKTLKDKCFLLVLDDLWVNDDNQKELDILLDMLRHSAAQRGSRVLVTAQKADAAGALRVHLQPFSITDLEEKVYLSLLMHHAGPFATGDYGQYERIGSRIAKRLRRSPIAAVTVGKQLRNKSTSFWETTAELDVLKQTMGALWWSYQQLGDDVRRCFAYFSIVPKAYIFEREKVVRIWIAQGFVKTRYNSTEELEDIGQNYFDQLQTLSFLQVHRTRFFDGIVEFTIHDLLHDLAERVCGCEFFRIGLNNGSTKDIPRGVRHLFIETNNVVEINEKILDQRNLRTLIIKENPYKIIYEGSDEEIPEIKRNHDIERFLERLFMRPMRLRVLIIDVIFFTLKLLVPAPIGHMKHLRYLAFHFHDPLMNLILPSTFTKLYHLQIIDIPCHIESWPKDMTNLTYLRHISALLCCPNIGGLSSLQTLRRFIVKEERGYELMQLKHLNKLQGTLTIEGLEIVRSKDEALEAHLTHKEGLRELWLDFGRDKRRFGPDMEAEVLEGLCPPKDLQELKIWYYRGSRYPRWMLTGHHPDAPKQLQRLELSRCSSQLASIPEGSKLFIGLCQLYIYFCDWDWLPQNMERLVSLQTLNITGCNKVDNLPTLPHQALKKIIIFSCDVLSKTCKEEGHGNWHKIQHIPEKLIFE